MGTPGPDSKPCGACGKLVDSHIGCAHWKPDAKTGKRVGWVKGRARQGEPPAPAMPAPSLGFLQLLDNQARPRVG